MASGASYPLSPRIIVKDKPQFEGGAKSSLYNQALATVQDPRQYGAQPRGVPFKSTDRHLPPSPVERPPSPFQLPPSPREAISPASAREYPWDERFESEKVETLNELNFDRYLEEKEKALILFYNTIRRHQRNPEVEHEFSTAADSNERDYYGYATVDCFNNKDLCDREFVRKLPMFKLFSNGFAVSSILHTDGFKADQMDLLMKMTPILTQPRVAIDKEASQNRQPSKLRRFLCI